MKRKVLIAAASETKLVSQLGEVLFNEAQIMVKNKPNRITIEIKDLNLVQKVDAIRLFKTEELNGAGIDDAVIYRIIKDNSKIVEINYESIPQPRPEKMEIMDERESNGI